MNRRVASSGTGLCAHSLYGRSRTNEETFQRETRQFVLAKNGCATGLTTAVVDIEISGNFENLIVVRGRDVGPVAFHGD